MPPAHTSRVRWNAKNNWFTSRLLSLQIFLIYSQKWILSINVFHGKAFGAKMARTESMFTWGDGHQWAGSRSRQPRRWLCRLGRLGRSTRWFRARRGVLLGFRRSSLRRSRFGTLRRWSRICEIIPLLMHGSILVALSVFLTRNCIHRCRCYRFRISRFGHSLSHPMARPKQRRQGRQKRVTVDGNNFHYCLSKKKLWRDATR